MTHPCGRLLRIAAVAAMSGLALGLGGTTPASAEDGAVIDHAAPTGDSVRLLVSVPGSEAVDLEGVQVTIGDRKVGARAAAASASSDVERTTVLAIDTSRSMAGTRIAEAKKAATAYLDTVPANVLVGVLTFDDAVTVEVPPGLDRDAARTAVSKVRLTRETALYDGVLGALKAAGPGGEDAGQRKVLVLSDGKDTTDTSLGQVVEAIEKSGAGVDVVSLQQGDEANEPLKAIASAGRGTVLTTADPAALTDAFAREADALARQIVVTAQLPPGFEETSSNVSVTVPTDAASYAATAYVPVRSAAAAASDAAERALPETVATGPFDVTETVMYGGIAAMGIGLVGIIVALAFGSRKPATHLTLTEQVQAYGVMSVPGQPGPRREAAPQQAFGQARQAAEKALANNKNLEARLASSLESAGVALRPAEWLLMRAGIAVAGAMLGLLIGAGSVVLGVLLVLVALVGPTVYLKVKRARRLKAFSSGLADTLQLMSGSLSAGLSLAQSIDTIVREGSEPIASEFRRVVVESRLGVTLEDSLDGVAARMDSRDFQWVVMAIRIQREVGGNLAELLLTVAGTLRERDYLRRHVRALSAEGRLSCWILGGLPPGFLLYLALSKPDYVEPMFSTPIGWLLCIGMTVLLGVGVLWMSKVAKVDV
jgi:tight adherence protein B